MTNETGIKSILLNKVSLWYMRFWATEIWKLKKFGTIPHPLLELSVALQNWTAYKSSIQKSKLGGHFGDFRKYGSRAKNDNENEFFDPKLL